MTDLLTEMAEVEDSSAFATVPAKHLTPGNTIVERELHGRKHRDRFAKIHAVELQACGAHTVHVRVNGPKGPVWCYAFDARVRIMA